jgi:23S rRNA (guanosine2251-2'-O)-methyltransferase
MKIILVLDNVRSAFNVGSVFRTADGLGADVHLIGISPIPGQDKKLDKTSLSAIDSVEWKYFDNAQNWFKYILLTRPQEGRSNKIISFEENIELKAIPFFNMEKELVKDLERIENIYVVFGHEINGVSEFVQNKSDFVMTIPMYGKKNSLNVATCVGIVGYRIREILENKFKSQS